MLSEDLLTDREDSMQTDDLSLLRSQAFETSTLYVLQLILYPLARWFTLNAGSQVLLSDS